MTGTVASSSPHEVSRSLIIIAPSAPLCDACKCSKWLFIINVLQLLYDIDGVRVVETRMPPLWLQESYELLPAWSEGAPTPQYFPPHPGPLTSALHTLKSALGYKKPLQQPSPPLRVTLVAQRVSVHLHQRVNHHFLHTSPRPPPLSGQGAKLSKHVSKFSSFPCLEVWFQFYIPHTLLNASHTLM